MEPVKGWSNHCPTESHMWVPGSWHLVTEVTAALFIHCAAEMQGAPAGHAGDCGSGLRSRPAQEGRITVPLITATTC